MKLGGNQNAYNFFNKHGGVDRYRNVKEKYSSSTAVQYKQYLKKLIEDDAKASPNCIVLEVETSNTNDVNNGEKNDESTNGKADFFDNWGNDLDGLPTDDTTNKANISNEDIEPSEPKNDANTVTYTTIVYYPENLPADIARIEPKTFTKTVTEQTSTSNKPTIPSSGTNEFISGKLSEDSFPRTSGVGIANSPSSGSIGTNNSGFGGLKGAKKGLGAKKVSKPLNFEEAEKRAKEQEEARLRKEEEDKRKKIEEEAEAARIAQEKKVQLEAERKKQELEAEKRRREKSTTSDFGSNIGERNMTKDEQAVMERLGMGLGGMKFGSALTSAPATSSTAAAAPSVPYTNEPGDVQKRFGNAKSLSSDQYFGRGAYDAQASKEAQDRLQQFNGRSGFGSSEYYGRKDEEHSPDDALDEDYGNSSSNYDPNDPLTLLGESAREFATKFASQAQEDISNLKKLVDNFFL